MTVFHGSICEVRTPDLSRSKKNIDFGPGFYVTTIRHQAERWAKRKAARLGGEAVVTEFNMLDDWSAYRVKTFPVASVEWLDFVCACRKGGSDYCKYDVISGPVADDDVFKTVDMFFRGLWDKEKTLSELRFSEPNDQYCFVSQEALTTILSFKDYKALDV